MFGESEGQSGRKSDGRGEGGGKTNGLEANKDMREVRKVRR